MSVLVLSKISKNFRGLTAVSDLDLQVNEGELVGLIGPNGAGKTTVFNIITGIFRPTEGDITLMGRSIVKMKPHQISRLGIARTFQITNLFGDLTVKQNVTVGGETHAGLGIGFMESFFPKPQSKKLEQKVMDLMDFVGIIEFKDELAKNLPHGHQRLVQLSIALATEPKVLLLDEPVSGMNVEEITRMMELVNSLRRDGKISILLIEHNMRAVMNYCDRICVLDFGKQIAEGAPYDIRQNETVIKAYLGQDDNATTG